MSCFKRNTKHPKTGKWERTDWLDNYFGEHHYGVKFSDGMVYDPEKIELETSQKIKLDKFDDVFPQVKGEELPKTKKQRIELANKVNKATEKEKIYPMPKNEQELAMIIAAERSVVGMNAIELAYDMVVKFKADAIGAIEKLPIYSRIDGSKRVEYIDRKELITKLRNL